MTRSRAVCPAVPTDHPHMAAQSAAAAPAAVPKGFGSFHTADVEVLIAQTDAEYVPPAWPVAVARVEAEWLARLRARGDAPAFGAEAIKRELFLLEAGWTFVNHGAFGAALRPAVEVAHAWQLHMESQPLRFLDREALPLLVATIRELARRVHCSPCDLVLVPNATYGLNCIFRSAVRAGDAVLTLDITYGAVKKMLQRICAEVGATYSELPIPLPLRSGAQLVAHVDAALAERRASGRPVTLAVFDYISSNTALLLPVRELTRVCHARGARVAVDGAHALFSEEVDLEALGADFFVANAHKWLSSAKGCAMLFVDAQHRADFKPLVISHGSGRGFTSDFVWSGLMDYGKFLCLSTTLRVWDALGVARARSYCRDLLLWAARHLAARWNTELFAGDEALFSLMATVRLPGPEAPRSEGEHEELQDALHMRYAIEVPIKKLYNRLYVRISAHVYNTRDEYARLADAVLELRGAAPKPQT